MVDCTKYYFLAKIWYIYWALQNIAIHFLTLKLTQKQDIYFKFVYNKNTVISPPQIFCNMVGFHIAGHKYLPI